MNRNESVRGGPTGRGIDAECPGTTTALLGEISQRRAQVQHRIIVIKGDAILLDEAVDDVRVWLLERPVRP